MDIKLQSQLNIGLVCELKLELDAAIEASATSENIKVDVSKVDSIDTATLQLLLSFKQQLSIEKIQIDWHKPSDSFLASVKLMGLHEILD